MKCPLCNEEDFDLIGLKVHLLRGHCDEFNHCLSPEEERRDRNLETEHFHYNAATRTLTVK